MQKVNNNTEIPKNSYLAKEKADKKLSASSDQIIKKTPFIGARIVADKLAKDVFVYAPKGLNGSRNSNFYEFLSLGLVPNIVGSAMLMALFNAANKGFRMPDRFFAGFNGTKMATGVVFYAVGKWLGGKIINKGIEQKTGVDLEMPYRKVVTELPEDKNDKNLSAVEYHKVFESADFPRWDLLNKQGEEKGDRYAWYDKIARRMGYKEDLNSPDQIVQPKVKDIIVRANAAKSISTALWAATGVALASQDAFGKGFIVKTGKGLKGFDLKASLHKTVSAFKKGFKGLLSGQNTEHTKASKPIGRFLFFASILSSVFGILNATKDFKANPKERNTKINTRKDYEVM